MVAESMSLSGGVVSWTQGADAFAYEISRRRAAHWAVPGADPRLFQPAVTALHTRNAIVAAAATRAVCPKTCAIEEVDLYIADLP